MSQVKTALKADKDLAVCQVSLAKRVTKVLKEPDLIWLI